MIAPPQKNLGAGDEWGRWVERTLREREAHRLQETQGLERTLASVNGVLSQVTNLWNATPLTEGYNTQSDKAIMPKTPSGQLADWTENLQWSFPVPDGKVISLFVTSHATIRISGGPYRTFLTRVRVITSNTTIEANSESSVDGGSPDGSLQTATRTDIFNFGGLSGNVTLALDVKPLALTISADQTYAGNTVKLGVLALYS